MCNVKFNSSQVEARASAASRRGNPAVRRPVGAVRGGQQDVQRQAAQRSNLARRGRCSRLQRRWRGTLARAWPLHLCLPRLPACNAAVPGRAKRGPGGVCQLGGVRGEAADGGAGRHSLDVAAADALAGRSRAPGAAGDQQPGAAADGQVGQEALQGLHLRHVEGGGLGVWSAVGRGFAPMSSCRLAQSQGFPCKTASPSLERTRLLRCRVHPHALADARAASREDWRTSNPPTHAPHAHETPGRATPGPVWAMSRGGLQRLAPTRLP